LDRNIERERERERERVKGKGVDQERRGWGGEKERGTGKEREVQLTNQVAEKGLINQWLVEREWSSERGWGLFPPPPCSTKRQREG